MKNVNIVLGSYLNGYSIIQELHENNISEIIVIDVEKSVSSYSNKIKQFIKIENSSESLYEALKNISLHYDLLIFYPNQDIYIKYLSELYPKIKEYSFLGFNHTNAVNYQNKMLQYDFCKKLGIPIPKTILISNKKTLEMSNLLQFLFPLLIKPTHRDNFNSKLFRNLLIKDIADFQKKIPILHKYIDNGINFIISEVIPGDGSNIFSYTAYRSKNGKILAEWGGKKLSQFPNDYGVFSSASNESVDIIFEYGQKLLDAMNLHGINQPEFKYDHRDRKYKLMEINLRPMMWHRVGTLSGVPLNYIQYLEAIKDPIPKYSQNIKTKIHYIYLNHEIINLLRRKKYFSIFKNNIWGGDKRVFALWDIKDPLPFSMSFFSIVKKYVRSLKRNRHVIN